MPSPPMFSLALADLVVALHVVFLLFIAIGVILVWRWPRLAWAHVPAVVWALAIAWRPGTECPLTPLEKYFRRLAGQAVYPGGFLDHYVSPVLLQHARTAGVLIVIANAIGYTVAIGRVRHRLPPTPRT